MNLPFDAAVKATQATLIGAERSPETLRIVTDTRVLVPGDTFLALRGERFNGHDYIREAISKGAEAIVIDEAKASLDGTTTLLVDDTRAAYMSLAGLARDHFSGRVVAITGSNGKTTTKELLVQLLARCCNERILPTPANENNEIGVSKLLLAASPEAHGVLVIEMGARHAGDIAALVQIAKPQVGILTNIGEAHLGVMGSREALAQTKWALFDTGARAILNFNDKESRHRAPQLASEPHWFAATADERFPPELKPMTALIGSELLLVRTAHGDERRSVDVQIPGAHNRANLAAALAGALVLGCAVDALVAAIPTLVLPAGRFESFALPSGARLIYDAYNANVSGMLASLDAFAQEPGARHIAVLGSMAELGDDAPAMHARVGAHAADAHLDWLLLTGDFAQEMARSGCDAGLSSERIVTVATNQLAAEWLREHARAGDVVLLKGSRKYRLEEIVAELRA